MRLSLTVLAGEFAVWRLGSHDPVPSHVNGSAFLSVTRTSDELSIVCEAAAAPSGARCERGWRCLRVRGPLPFEMTGVLASVAVPLADAGVPAFAISTYDTDYVLVRERQLQEAITALEAVGHRIDDDAAELKP